MINFWGKNRRYVSSSIFLPAADCFDYAQVYEHPGPPEAFVRCAVAAAPSCRHRRWRQLTHSLSLK